MDAPGRGPTPASLLPGNKRPGASTSVSSCPSNYESAWNALRSKGIRATPHVAAEVGDDVSAVGPTDSELLSCVKSFAAADGRGEAILEVINSDSHDSEETFSRQLFWKVVQGFQRDGWRVYTAERRRSRVSARRADRIPGGGGGGDGDADGPAAEGPAGAGATQDGDVSGDPVVLDDMVILGREGADPTPDGATTTADASSRVGASKQYVVAVGDWKYAMGLSRKAMVREGDSASIIRGISYPDHSWAVFKKRNVGSGEDDNDAVGNGWIVHQILAVVELKMDDTACRSFPVKETTQGWGGDSAAGTLAVDLACFNPRNDHRFGPLGQELMYVVGHVLWGRAVLGLGLPSHLPFAVVAGRSAKRSSPPKDALRGVHGYLITPRECGGKFSFSIDGFDAFDVPSSGSMALTSYVSVMADGILAAEDWIATVANRAQLPKPSPMSGQRLMFGREILHNVPLALSPVSRSDDQVNAFRSPAPPTDPKWDGVKISQGELFCGKVNVSKLQEDAPQSRHVSWLVSPPEAAAKADPEGNNSVVVKVSSRASFGQLVNVQGYFWSHVVSRTGGSWDAVCRCLASSLYGIYTTDNLSGLVQIMPDLSSEGFVPLQPQLLKEMGRWSVLWTAFEKFVLGTLIPLAEADVIHPDLRPGYNCTANLLYHHEEEKIRMVDLDSLVTFDLWGVVEPVSDRYISLARVPAQRPIETPIEFVFKQAVVIAEAWVGSIHDGSADVDGLFAGNVSAQKWNGDESHVCDVAFVHGVLKGYRARFGVPMDGT